MRKLITFLALALLALNAQAQNESAPLPGIFDRLSSEMKNFKPDTSAVPEDRITRKIRQLRALRGGFNVNEAMEYKLSEEEKEGKTAPETIAYLRKEFSTGHGKELLDNAVIHIYRNRFTYPELKKLVKFYRSSAGQKFATDFPFIMLQTLAAGEQIVHDNLSQRK